MWLLIDGQLLSCLIATISPPILPQVLGLEQANQVWKSLEKRFSSLSRSQIYDLKNSLYNLKKTTTVQAYVNQIKEFARKLAATGSSLDDEELVYHTLKGLPPAFNSFKITMR